MEDKERQELETPEFTLEDIIREFSDHPETVQDSPAEETAAEEIPEEAESAQVEMPQEAEILEDTPQEEMLNEEPVREALSQSVEETVEEDAVQEVSEAEEAECVQQDVTVAEENTTEETVDLEAVAQEMEAAVSMDTVRLDSARLLKGMARNAVTIREEEETKPLPDVTAAEEKPAFTEGWEPEYEQPMGEYIPPQPIAFPSRASSRDIKHKLVIGPEKRYYELTEKGLGKLQLAILLSFIIVLVSAASTIMFARGSVPESRMRLMIFSQCMAVLVSGLLGSFQLIQGVADLFKGRFTLNTLLVVTFVACCADGVFCLLQERIPCCAAFSLEVMMSLWSAYHKRHAELGQMDVLRKANRLNGICTKSDAYEGNAVALRIPGEVEDFMDNFDQVSEPEKRQAVYALIALGFSLAVGVFAVIVQDLYMGIQMTAVSLLAAVPATSFIANSRPFAILQRRLHRLGAVLCGWQGVKQLSRQVVFPIRGEDIFPMGSMRMNGVKFFGERPTDMVVAYATAVVVAEGSGLAPVFTQVLDSRNGRHYDAQDLYRYEGGGIGGTVLDEAVLVGSLQFLKDMGVEVPEGIQVSQAVCVAIEGELCGVFAISYEKTRSATAGLSTLSSYRKLSPVVVSGEFMLSEAFIRGKFGVKSKRLQFPNEEVRQQLRQITPDENTSAALLTTLDGLAPMAYGVTGARALRSACNFGTWLHIAGGALGMAVVLVLMIVDAMYLLTPVNMFLYQLVWIIPGLLLTEWTRSL